MKSSESTFRKILSALLSGTMLMGVMSAAAVAMPGSISIPVAALGDEGEGPLIPPDDPVDPDDAPDPDQEYSEEFDVRVEVKKSSGGIDLPFVPAPTASGTFDNGVKWEYYAQGVMGDAHLYFATATASNSDIPASAITTIYSTSQDAIKKSKSFSMALIKNIGDNAFDTSLAHIVGKLDLKTLSFDKIETIGIRAFAGFKDIKDIVFPESLVSIGSEAFNEVNTTITFSGTKSIEFGKDAFKKLNDKQSVVIPYGSTYNDGETVVTIVPENNKYAAVFGKATVTVKDEYTCFPEVPATCTTSGTIEYYRDCKGDYFVKDGDSYTQITKAETVTDPLGHKCEEYNYKWAGVFVQKADDSYPEKPDYLACYNEYECTVCHENIQDEVALNKLNAAATCTRNEKTIYWFDYVDSNNETQRQIRQITKSAALGHEYDEPEYVWADDYSTCTASRVCTRDDTHVETETVNTTSAPDPDAPQNTVYTATFTNEAFGTVTKTKVPSFVFKTEAALDAVNTITKGNEAVNIQEVVPVFEGNYSIYSSRPLTFSAEPDDEEISQDYATFYYNFALEGTEVIEVSLADLPAVTFDQGLTTNDLINEFKRNGNEVDPDEYDDLSVGEYLLSAFVPLGFVNQSQEGNDVEFTFSCYADGIYYYYMVIDAKTGDFLVNESDEDPFVTVPLTIAEHGAVKLAAIDMISGESSILSIYDSETGYAPETIQAGVDYEIIGTEKLYIKGATVNNKTISVNGENVTWHYSVSVPEDSEGLFIDFKDVMFCDFYYYDSEGNEIDLENLVYTGEDLTPASVVVKDGDYTLTEGEDYSIAFGGNWTDVTENLETDFPTVSYEGLGDYEHNDFYIYFPWTQSVTILAPETVTVTFDSQGGTEIDPQIVNYKGKATFPEVPEKDGFDFVGWYYGDEPFDFETALVGNITLTAQWVDELLNFSVIDQEAIQLGKAITVTAIAEGGTAPYTYAVSYKKHSSSTWTVKQDFNENDTVAIRPANATVYDILVTVKDANGITAEKTFEVNVFNKLVNTSEVEAENIGIGSEAVVNASAEGGLGEYEFAVFFKRADETNWRMLQDYDANTQVSFKPAYNTSYDIMVRARDERGVVVKKELNVNVFKPTNTSTVTEEVLQGQTIDVVCGSEDGYGECTYAVYYKKASASNWKLVQNYSENTEVSITPPSPGEYQVAVKVKDEFGTIVKSTFDVIVSGLVNTTQLSSYDLDGPGSVTVFCSAEGTTDGEYEFAVYYRQAGQTKWKTAQTYSENTEVEINLDSAGDWDICVKVRDSLGNIAKYYETVAVQDA